MGVIAVIVITVVLIAFLSGIEMTFLSVNKLQLEIEKKKEHFISKILTKLTTRYSNFTTSLLIAKTMFLIIYIVFMAKYLQSVIDIEGLNELSIIFIHTLIITFFIVILSEILPKIIFKIHADKALTIIAIPGYIIHFVFQTLAVSLTMSANYLLKLFLKSSGTVKSKEFNKQDLENFITQQIEKAKNTAQIDSEIQLFQNALKFNNVKAREVMIPRTEIKALKINDSIQALNQLFISSGNSKIIVYDNNLDHVLGYVHVFDMFKKSAQIEQILKPIAMVPESMRINYVLNMLIKKRKSIAIVIDEYGGTSGLLTVEDIVEVLFGDIEDEHDSNELLEKKLNENSYQFSARLEVEYINDTYKLNLPEDESYETIGGMLMSYTETIPELGEIIKINHYQFTITKVSTNKIETVSLLIKEH